MNTIGNKSLVVNTELISVLLVEDSMPDARYVQEILPANLYVTLHAKSLGEACKKVAYAMHRRNFAGSVIA
jgi:hypothetical protein